MWKSFCDSTSTAYMHNLAFLLDYKHHIVYTAYKYPALYN
jgi:hypothetical protein